MEQIYGHNILNMEQTYMDTLTPMMISNIDIFLFWLSTTHMEKTHEHNVVVDGDHGHRPGVYS